MTGTDNYTYKPLSAYADDEIRLLHLAPGTGDDVIQFTLQPTRLSEMPSYEAISYRWGDPSDTLIVLCDGKTMTINANLHAALLRLRHADVTRVLWADAACIDQANVAEKNHQVNMMGRIYTQPTRVLIWLGEGDAELQGLEECIRTALELLPPEVFKWEELYETSRRVFQEALKLQREGKPNFIDHDWRPIASIFRRPWFDRRWIIQEVASSAEHVQRLAICGDVEFAWDDLASVAYRLVAYALTFITGISAVNPSSPYLGSFFADNRRPVKMIAATYMIFLLRHYRDRGGTLLDGVIATSLFNCSDPRDHLYSLLSLPRTPAGFKPDYALTAEEMCRQFAIKSLVGDRNLKLLAIAPHTAFTGPPISTGPPARLDLPSWVPDLTCQGNGMVEPVVAFPVRPQAFHAGGRDEKPAAAISSDGKVLHLRGRFVDKVAATATPLMSVPLPPDAEVLPHTGLSARSKKRMVNWLRECREVAAEGDWEARALDPAFRCAFTETILCGMTGMRDPAPEEVIMATQVYSEYVFDFFTDGYYPSDHVNSVLTTYGVLIEQPLMALTAARRLCRTEEGRLGQVRNEARVGDLFCVILGAEVPYLLRPSPGKPGVYTLVGDSYLHGVMQGEALEDDRYETVGIMIE